MAAKAKALPKTRKKLNTATSGKPKPSVQAKSKTRPKVKKNVQAVEKIKVVNRIAPPRISSSSDERKAGKGIRNTPQYLYMKAPGGMHDFQVGKKVEVFCDHDKSKERIRGWVGGVVVQVDNKMVAVQFGTNVYLTDGWMVPDRILWYPLNSEHIRQVGGLKSIKKDKAIPDY